MPNQPHSDPRALLEATRSLVDRALDRALQRTTEPRAEELNAHAAPARLMEAMRYAALAPGKRLRPALALCAAEALGASWEDALPGACAVEMIHAYSLVHDDLPALDDDDLRRGRPSCHRAFDEATALLTGDALLTEAFAVLSDPRPLLEGRVIDPARRAAAVLELARAAGAGGMVGGQVDDLQMELAQAPDTKAPIEAVLSVHRRKTGRLIAAAAALGGHLAGGSAEQLSALRTFGASVGLAFQLVDDVLDSDGLAQTRGYDAREEAQKLTREAHAALERLGPGGANLRLIATAMAERKV